MSNATDLNEVGLVDVVRRLVVLGLSVGELPTHICVHRPVDAVRLLPRLKLIHSRIAMCERLGRKASLIDSNSSSTESVGDAAGQPTDTAQATETERATETAQATTQAQA